MVLKFPVEKIIENIYEAAFDPDRWVVVLRHLTTITESASTGIGIIDESGGFGVFDEYNTRQPGDGFWLKSDTSRRHFIDYAKRGAPSGFTNHNTYFPRDYPNLAEINDKLKARNIADQLGVTINLPTGQVVTFASERWLRDGIYPNAVGAKLEIFVSHLARATLLSATMGNKRAVGTMAILNTLGLPAAMLSTRGKVIETNDLINQATGSVRPIAWGMLRLTQKGADNELQKIIAEMRAGLAPRAKSIPISSDGEHQVIHAIPISKSTRDFFYEARLLLVITKVSATALVPPREILMHLYDLTDAEARLAQALAAGRNLHDCAKLLGIGYGTARSYLVRIFRKTDASQQSELVAILKTAAQISIT